METWVLGATGRSGRAVTTELVSRGLTPVLVGRDAARLAEAADRIGGARTVVAASVTAAGEEIRRQRPVAVINTVGPFRATATPIAHACLDAGAHYVDLANEVSALATTLALDARATTAGRSVVTGAGFGVTATESVVVALCADRPPAAEVRVDMVPSLAMEAGELGDALAATMLDGLPGFEGGRRFQGRRYRRGRPAPARLGGDATPLTLPDGSRVVTVGMPLGELIAAQRASGAPEVVAASSEAAPLRHVLPLASVLLEFAPLRTFAIRRFARVRFGARPASRAHSWGHARVRWADGTVREGWLRLGDAQAYTGAVPAEVTRRLLAGEGRPGAHTPAALFGPSLAESCGGEFLLDHPVTA
ncbi:saccharopine dehydrogenase NADP-binding domain-containing protein [Catenuloplanes atrovinosus]|uniref:Short subunit dehydrogenase-like uncharacterized protein n=1 Tax=Catenuloplanes atrovinosus TaxID=137266 RepID=A0AAE4C9J8_9ACTN|nr:saccharopine dehydrogenase NADP-binding domain-containing protein [Catenuloplanes atrovinosus]MDR7276133.1 short subunit dehydrogenase-like uncharacterized protein [Catenuloplanes atrovinosus]